MDIFKNVAQTLWIGALWAIGFVAAPVLFRVLDKSHAGMAVGVMLGWVAWIGIVCGIFLLIHAIYAHGFRAVKTAPFWLIMGMLFCTVVNHFAVFPIVAELKTHASAAAKGVLGDGFSTWHTISSLIYLLQCVLGLLLIVKDSASGR